MCRIRRILIADDDGTDRESLKAHLTQAGYDVELTCDGQFTLDKARSFLPDLILLNAMSREFNSFDICRALKDDFQLGKIMVLMMTPLEVGAIQRGIEAGADDFVSKPFNTREFLERIESALRLSDANGK